MQNNQDVGRNAGKYFRNGFHCAEAVVAAVLESRGVDPSQAVAHSTPFGGGVGRTFCEVCGAISGGLIAIGSLCGRSRLGESWDIPADMGVELRERFASQYGETGCGVLRNRFGERQLEECARVVEVVARDTDDILSEWI